MPKSRRFIPVLGRYINMKLIIHAILVLSAMAMLAGCVVKSNHKTRSFMTEEEIAEINSLYFPEQGVPQTSEPGEPVQSGRHYEPFLAEIRGPVMKVNGLDVNAEDIRSLYLYYASYRDEDALQLKQEACMHWILTYAVMSQWPDKIQPAIDRLNEIKNLITPEIDFSNLIIENTQEPDGVTNRGDFGERTRDQMTDIYEMHASTDPLMEVSGPFPDILGWYLIQPLSRNLEDPGNFSFHARHLLLFHGLEPQNVNIIKANLERYRNQAQVELLNPELEEVLPWFSHNIPPAGR